MTQHTAVVGIVSAWLKVMF